MKKILIIILLLVPNILFSQNILVKGVVFDENKTTVPGASVVEVGTKNGTNTDLQGGFSLEVRQGSLLEISFIGYSTQREKATSQMSVFLVPETTSLEDVVVVGYRTVKKESLTGAVANITNKDIVSTKSSNLAVDLAGKVAGFNIRQRNGQPGLFATDINIRGMGSPLFIIDGIVRDGATEFQRLNPEDIESISFLKDGTAAIYGMNSSNGAVIVTTKTGGNRKPEITFSSNVGFASPTYMPKMCNAAQWYELMVDGQVNIGNSPYITSSELEAWRSGAEGHQSYDYYDALFKNFSMQQQNTVSITGGNARTSYFASIAYSNDDGLLKKGGTSYNQYSIRSNVKTKITDNLTANINMYGMRGTREQGFMNYQNVFFVSIVEPPITPIYANNNNNYYNNFTYGINPVAGSDRRSTSGYDKLDSKSFQSLLSLDYSAPF
jgi:TonB-linked SusC/RagA family outer membrane protein